MRADALLARNDQMRCQQPLVERHFAAFEHGADRDGVLLAAIVALDHALTHRAFGMRLGCAPALFGQALGIERTTMRADRPFRPMQSLKMLAGCVCVDEAGGG